MALRHMKPHLPKCVEMLEQDALGTPSGNPTSPVVYGFKRESDLHKPAFAIARVRPEDGKCSEVRTVSAFGTLTEQEYAHAFGMILEDQVEGWAAMLQQLHVPLNNTVEITMSVPHQRCSEYIIGHALQIVFNDEIR